jgi:transposase-like protein
VDASNIQVYCYVERRFYCTTCSHTFSAARGTFFETLRSERQVVVEVLEALGERNSLRALERLKHHSPNTILDWLDLAGQHLAAVSAELIYDVRLRQAQVDELWTFVKKNKSISSPTIRSMSVTCGSGEPALCRVACGLSVTSATSVVKWKRPSF